MTRSADYSGDMNAVAELLDDLRADGSVSAAGDAELAEFLGELDALGVGAAPAPSAELTVLLAGVTPLAVSPSRVPVRSLAIAAAAVIAMLTSLAASHQLPRPAQRMVSNVVNTLTPFHIDPNGQPMSERNPRRTRSPAPPVDAAAPRLSAVALPPSGDRASTPARDSHAGGAGARPGRTTRQPGDSHGLHRGRSRHGADSGHSGTGKGHGNWSGHGRHRGSDRRHRGGSGHSGGQGRGTALQQAATARFAGHDWYRPHYEFRGSGGGSQV